MNSIPEQDFLKVEFISLAILILRIIPHKPVDWTAQVLFLVVGMGFFLALLNAVTRDISNALGIIMYLGMFVTPIIYPPPTSWPMSFLINYVNPISSFVTASRDLLIKGTITHPTIYLSSFILSFLLFLVGWRIFHLTESKVAERV